MVGGVGTGGVVAHAGCASSRKSGVDGVRCQADGVQHGLPNEPLNLPLPDLSRAHGAPFEAAYLRLSCVDAAKTEVKQAVSCVPPDSKGVFDEILEVLLEDGHVEKAFPLALLTKAEPLFDSNLHVGRRFGPNVERREDADAANCGADELFCNAWEAKPLSEAGPKKAGLAEPVVEACSEHRFPEGYAVEGEVLVSRTHGEVEPFVWMGVHLEVGRAVGSVVYRVSCARVIEFGNAAGALGVEAACGGPVFSPIPRSVLALPGVGSVALVVVVVIDKLEKAALDSVIPSAIGTFEMGVNGDHALHGACVCARSGGVKSCICICPQQCVYPLSADGIGAKAIPPTAVFRGVFPGAIDAPLSLGVIMIHSKGVVRAVVGQPGSGIDLGSFVSITSLPLASKADAVSIVEPPGVQPRSAALHQTAVPVFAPISRVAKHTMLDRDPRERFWVGESGAELDDPAQCRGAIKNAACPFDDLDLF